MPQFPPSSTFIDSLRFGALLVVAQLTIHEYSVSGSLVNQVSLPVSTASITIDRNSATRRSGQISVELSPSVPPPALLPTGPPTPANPQPLAPFGNEVEVSLGLAVGDHGPAGPLSNTVGVTYAGSKTVTVTQISNGGDVNIAVGSQIAIGNAAPVTVTGITGTGPYIISFRPRLTAGQPAGVSVQLVQLVSLGLFTITSSIVDATASNLVVTLDLSDRSFILAARTLTGPYNFPSTASGTFEAEVTNLLNKAWGSYPNMPPLTFNFSGVNNSVVPSASYNQGSSPWQMALDLAAVTGNELYIDAFGVVTAHAIPDPTKTPVSWYFTDDSSQVFSSAGFTISSGSSYSVPIGVQVAFTRSGIFNEVFITGSGTQNAPGASSNSSTGPGTGAGTSTTSASPVLGHAADTTPSSATFIDGPLGLLPEFTSSNLVPTPAQAQAMASLDLAMSISSAWQVMVTTQPNPLFDIDDVVSVKYPGVGVVAPDNKRGLCMVIDTIAIGVTYADTCAVTGRVVPGRYA